LISEERESATVPPRGERRGTGLLWLLRRSILGAALILYTLLFAELFVRVFDPQPVMPRYITAAPWGVRGNIPHADYWHHTPEVDVEYRINGQGLRADHDYPFTKPPGLCRVGLFGDSFLFGLEVDQRDSLAGRLQALLQQRGIAVEVLNFSVGGFGTAEMLQTYERFGRKFDLDVVLFSWDSSDLGDNVRSDLYRLRDGQLERANSEYLPAVDFQDRLMRYRLYRLINDHSQLYTFVRERSSLLIKQYLKSAEKQRLANPDAGGAEEDLDELQHRNAVDLSAAILLRAQDVVRESGQDFYLIDIPAHLSRTRFATTLRLFPASVISQIKLISPLAALSKAARPDLKLYYERGLGHFTPTGVEIVAEQTVAAIAASPRFASCSAGAAPTADSEPR
jgi:hypothetical protein